MIREKNPVRLIYERKCGRQRALPALFLPATSSYGEGVRARGSEASNGSASCSVMELRWISVWPRAKHPEAPDIRLRSQAQGAMKLCLGHGRSS